MKKLFCILLAFSICFSMSACKKKVVDPIDDNYRVFYQIFVGSFSDSNGDGIGDIQGIIKRMDYLNDGNINSGKSLGVQGIWLSPIFLSPSYHGYDVTDYYTIDPKYGTMEDLQKLIDLCHERNIKLILDLPINHTSSQNQWFTNFKLAHQANNTYNMYYDYYSYATKDTRTAGIQWNLINGSSDYYECNFDGGMPELNFDSEKVRQQCVDIAKYYLDMGIDGFRFDAVKYIYYGQSDRNVEFWDWYMSQLREIKEDIYCVGECWSSDTEVISYASSLNCFNFTSSQAEGSIAMAAKGDNVNSFTRYVTNYLTRLKMKNPDAMYEIFISNHDMDRSAGYLMMANKFSYIAANLYILCSGSPIIYYGEEIGLKGTRGSSNTDANRRLAMLWGDGDTVSNPEGATYPDEKQTNGTVAEQLKKDDSLYNYYCRVIALRNKYPQIARGDYSQMKFTDTYVGGFIIEYEGETTYLIHNTQPVEKTIDLNTVSGVNLTKILDYIGQGTAKLDGTKLTIGPQTSVIAQ